ncbi:MAG: dienelactone hydrolase family protein [Vulcanimicrobiaceae bacterium]
MKANELVGEHEVSIGPRDETIVGTLTLPAQARSGVIFAHGSGSSRFSPRNRFVAQVLQKHSSIATLLLDLLTPVEETIDEQTAELRFDISLLARRLVTATDWFHERLPKLRIGYFGASTGAAGALVASTERPDLVHAIVSRGGRPDLAGSALARVRAPTLLIVGGRDTDVLALNELAARMLGGRCELRIVPNATHLFEEPGALKQVAQLAVEWFATMIGPAT